LTQRSNQLGLIIHIFINWKKKGKKLVKSCMKKFAPKHQKICIINVNIILIALCIHTIIWYSFRLFSEDCKNVFWKSCPSQGQLFELNLSSYRCYCSPYYAKACSELVRSISAT